MSSKLKYKVYTSSQIGFAVSSTLVYGEKEAILIDSQMLPHEAQAVLKIIKETGVELTKILITHAHLDHFGGTEVFVKTFPDIEVLAEGGVVDLIKTTGEKQVKDLERLYKNDKITPKEIIIPKAFSSSKIAFENNDIEIITNLQGDFAPHSAFYIENLKMMLVGDLVYPGWHAWTADTDNQQRENWIKSLEQLKSYEIEHLITGHKAKEAPESADYIDEDIDYLKFFNDANDKTNTAKELIDLVLSKYPNLAQKSSLTIGAYTNKKETFNILEALKDN